MDFYREAEEFQLSKINYRGIPSPRSQEKTVSELTKLLKEVHRHGWNSAVEAIAEVVPEKRQMEIILRLKKLKMDYN